MSASAATATRAIARPARRPTAPSRPPLQLVTPLPGRRSNLPFVLLCSFVLAAGLFAVLLLNMSMSQSSYEMADLQKRSSLAADQAAALRADIAAESGTGRLAERATQLGMVPAGTSIFLSLPDGKVLGVAPQDPPKVPLKVAGTQTKPAQTKPGQAATPSPSGAATPANQPEAQPTGRPGNDGQTATTQGR